MSPDEVVDTLRATPERTALLFDFDGTLSPIVDRPAAARPTPGAPEVLDALTARYRSVGVISGRPVEFLARHLPPSVHLSGLYGLESRIAGVATVDPRAEPWRRIVAEAARHAEDAVDADPAMRGGVEVESKGLSLTLHSRSRPTAQPAVEALASALSRDLGLSARPAKMSVELHPPIAADKGSALEAIAAGSATVLFAGDDLGDLPAFDALEGLSAAGATTIAVAVGSDELPEVLRGRADLVLDGPEALLELLGRL